MPLPQDNGETISPSYAKLHAMACKLSGLFEKLEKIEKLYHSLDVETLLNDWINQLKLAEFGMFAIK